MELVSRGVSRGGVQEGKGCSAEHEGCGGHRRVSPDVVAMGTLRLSDGIPLQKKLKNRFLHEVTTF